MGVAELVTGIDSTLNDLRHQVSALETARAALTGSNGTTVPGPASSGPASPPARKSNGRGRGRPRGGGNRSEQALKIVSEHPGIHIPDIADKMGIQPNYLYRVLPGLEKAGQLRRDGQGWFSAS